MGGSNNTRVIILVFFALVTILCAALLAQWPHDPHQVAITALQKVVAAEPTSSEAWANLGAMMLDESVRSTQAARIQLKTAFALDPNNYASIFFAREKIAQLARAQDELKAWIASAQERQNLQQQTPDVQPVVRAQRAPLSMSETTSSSSSSSSSSSANPASNSDLSYIVDPTQLPPSHEVSNNFFGQVVNVKLRPAEWVEAAAPYFHLPYTVKPCAHEEDEEGKWEVYNYNDSFKPAWAEQDGGGNADKSLGERRLTNLHGVPFHVDRAPPEFLDDFGELEAHLLKMEKEWMKLPIRDWKNRAGPSYNTTSARYDQFNVLTLADKVPIVGRLKNYFKEVHADTAHLAATMLASPPPPPPPPHTLSPSTFRR
jgi:hypothetical protein